MKGIGDKIYKLRTDARLSQDELAEILAVSRQTVSNWETERVKPDLEKIVLLCQKFGVSIDELLLDKPSAPADEVALPAQPAAEAPAAPRRITKKRLISALIISAAAMVALIVFAFIVLLFDHDTATASLLTIEVSLFIGLMLGAGLFFVLIVILLIVFFGERRG